MSVYVKLTYLRQSPAAVPVFCLGTSERAGRSPARAETCYYMRMRKRRTEALRGSRKLLKMLSRIPDDGSPFASNKHLLGVVRRRREEADTCLAFYTRWDYMLGISSETSIIRGAQR
ncbi:hypothetical protein ALC53_05296 [Atta colombica]|uniref:Uncharacterized protein n=1 Tax=Atta colombica TaxID=520822 RepID=A0A195BI58_9HYME|nr:hypothetical protein ALC53_05296 [Atta colombica]